MHSTESEPAASNDLEALLALILARRAAVARELEFA
jgi:hypothetical protein